MDAGEHVSLDDLERYHLALLDEGGRKAIDEHLDQCEYCRDRALAIERFVKLAVGEKFRAPWR